MKGIAKACLTITVLKLRTQIKSPLRVYTKNHNFSFVEIQHLVVQGSQFTSQYYIWQKIIR
jgi:hypothetical protein